MHTQNKLHTHLLFTAFFCFALLFAAADADALNQEISLIPNSSTPSVGSSVSITAQYNCADNSVTTLGIRIHFDSAKLTYYGYDSYFSASAIASPQLQEDTENKDNDSSTDKLLLLGWQDINGNWPGQTLPLTLARLSFTAAATGSTIVNVSKVTGAAGFGFAGSGTTLTIGTIALPILTTNSVTSVSQTSATSGGNVTSDGGASVTVRGVCWNTSQNPTISNSKTSNGTGTGSFSSSLTGLSPNTTYYARAYATSSAGTAYGNQVSFTTAQALSVPTVTTNIVSTVTQTTAASGGNVTSDGGASVTARGVCWSTAQNPTIANSKTSNGTGTGTFTSSLTGLTANTTYYVRAYATNSKGTGYGNQVSFKTQSTYTISGYVRNSSNNYAVSGVTLTFSNSGGTVVSSSSGYYSKTVNTGWSGTVTPSLAGYTFSPANRTYSSIASSYFNQDFSATPITYIISGYVRNSSGTGISGVTVNFSNNAGSVLTGTSGYYSKSVTYGWSGTVTPQKSGYTFSPVSKTYTSVTANQASQNYTASPTAVPDISLSPESLTFTKANTGRSAERLAEPEESMEDQEVIPADGDYATGLLIPEEVQEYWENNIPTREYRMRRSIPASLDWSAYDSPVRNQGSCGSCWAFARWL